MKNIPKRRFPEFLNDWAFEELGKLGKFLGGGTPSKLIDEYWHGTIPWISSSDINEDDLKTIAITRFINEKSILESATKIIPKGSILFVSRVGTGKLAINDIDLCTSQDFTNFTPTQVSNYFLGYYFLANKSALTSLDQGTSIKGFSKSDLEKFKLIYPKDKQEQQKIADCLSSIDGLISAQSQKVELLKEHKKGLMQQLFPSDGEKVPTLRFPEFVNDGEWEEKKLGEICRFVRGPFGGSLKKDIFVKDGYAVYEQTHAIYQNFETFRYYITEEKFNELKRFAINPNDIIMSCSGTMGKFAIIPKNAKHGVINQALLKLTVKKEFDINFVKTTLELPLNQEKLLSQSAGGAIKNVVSVDQIKDISVCIPTPKEQQKIADCLSSVDEQISQQTSKLQTLKEHKKALMQQLFSSSEVN
ncbi:MAG: restriction endonuclease subunit S [Sulfurimonas sp.]|nr:restriction endonuclease subunit S [Sulfurimonas sp.]